MLNRGGLGLTKQVREGLKGKKLLLSSVSFPPVRCLRSLIHAPGPCPEPQRGGRPIPSAPRAAPSSYTGRVASAAAAVPRAPAPVAAVERGRRESVKGGPLPSSPRRRRRWRRGASGRRGRGGVEQQPAAIGRGI